MQPFRYLPITLKGVQSKIINFDWKSFNEFPKKKKWKEEKIENFYHNINRNVSVSLWDFYDSVTLMENTSIC